MLDCGAGFNGPPCSPYLIFKLPRASGRWIVAVVLRGSYSRRVATRDWSGQRLLPTAAGFSLPEKSSYTRGCACSNPLTASGFCGAAAPLERVCGGRAFEHDKPRVVTGRARPRCSGTPRLAPPSAAEVALVAAEAVSVVVGICSSMAQARARWGSGAADLSWRGRQWNGARGVITGCHTRWPLASRLDRLRHATAVQRQESENERLLIPVRHVADIAGEARGDMSSLEDLYSSEIGNLVGMGLELCSLPCVNGKVAGRGVAPRTPTPLTVLTRRPEGPHLGRWKHATSVRAR